MFGSGQKRTGRHHGRSDPLRRHERLTSRSLRLRDKLMRLEPVELSLPHFSMSQLAGLRATTKQAILSETHLTYWNKPSTRANLTFQALEPRGHHLPG